MASELLSNDRYSTKPSEWLPEKSTLSFKKLVKAVWKNTFYDGGNSELILDWLFKVHEKMIVQVDWNCFTSSKETLGDLCGLGWIESVRVRNIFQHVFSQFCLDQDCKEMFLNLEKVVLRIDHIESKSEVSHDFYIGGKTLQITLSGNLKQDPNKCAEPSIDSQVEKLTEAFDKIIEEEGGSGSAISSEKLLVSVDDLHVEDGFMTKPIDWIPKKGDKNFQEQAKGIWNDIMCYKYSLNDGILFNLHKLNKNAKFEFDWDSVLALPQELCWNFNNLENEENMTTATENAMKYIRTSCRWKAIVCSQVFPKFCEDSDAKVAFSQLRRILVTFRHSPDPMKDAGKDIRDFMFLPVEFNVEKDTLSIIISTNLPFLMNATCVCGYPDSNIEIGALYRAFDQYQISNNIFISSTLSSPNTRSVSSMSKQELDINPEFPTQPADWLPKNCYLSFLRAAKRIWKEKMYNKQSLSESVLDALYQKNSNLVLEIDWVSILSLPTSIVWNYSDPKSTKDMKSAVENVMHFFSITPRFVFLFDQVFGEFCKDSNCKDLFKKLRKIIYHVKYEKDVSKFEGLSQNTYGFIPHDFELQDTTLHVTLCGNLPLIMNSFATGGVPSTSREVMLITKAFDNARKTSSVFTETVSEETEGLVSSYVQASQKEELDTRQYFPTKSVDWLPTNYSMEHLKMAKNVWRTRMYRPAGALNPEAGVLVELYKLNPQAKFEVDWESVYSLPNDKQWNYWRPNTNTDMHNAVHNALVFLANQQRWKFLFEQTFPAFIADSDCKKLFLQLRKIVYRIREDLKSFEGLQESDYSFVCHQYHVEGTTLHVTLVVNSALCMNDPATCGVPSTDNEVKGLVRAFDSGKSVQLPPSQTVSSSKFKYPTDPESWLPSYSSIEFKQSARALWSGKMYSEYDTNNSKLLPILFAINQNMVMDIDWDSILNLPDNISWNYFGKPELKSATYNAMIFLKRSPRLKSLLNCFEEVCKDPNCNRQFQKLNRLVYHITHDPNRSKSFKSDHEGFVPHEYKVIGSVLHVSMIANLPALMTESEEICTPTTENEIAELSKAIGVSYKKSGNRTDSSGGISKLLSNISLNDIQRNIGKLKGIVNQIEKILK